METGNTNQQRTNNLFGEQNHFSKLVSDVMQPVRKYEQKKKKAKYVPARARFKMKVWYLDGNWSVHYSYDMHHEYKDGVKTRITDEYNGLTKLMKYLNSVNGQLLTGIIWTTLSDNTDTKIQAYNFQVVKYVKNSKPEINNYLDFKEGILDWKALVGKGGVK